MNEQSKELMHHGILGMKWGDQNGPPYPLGEGDHSRSEEKAGWKKSLDADHAEPKHAKLYDKLKRQTMPKSYEKMLNAVGLTKEDAVQTAKVLGVSLACAAGLYAVCAYPAISLGVHKLASDVNSSGWIRPYKIGDLLKNAKTSRSVDGIGQVAERYGYHIMPSRDLFKSAEIQALFSDRDRLIKQVRGSVVDSSAPRRLSCWSAAHAYFMSALTGRDYASRDFNNLVDFNDFGKLYNKEQNIFNLAGTAVKDFVGKPGSKLTRCGGNDAKMLIKSIVQNANTGNDSHGGTIGFINAAYHNLGCTHQWNFEITNGGSIFMSDGYSGDRWFVGMMVKGRENPVFDDSGLAKLIGELHHYNRDSVRFYAPKLSDINPETVSQIILGR